MSRKKRRRGLFVTQKRRQRLARAPLLHVNGVECADSNLCKRQWHLVPENAFLVSCAVAGFATIVIKEVPSISLPFPYF